MAVVLLTALDSDHIAELDVDSGFTSMPEWSSMLSIALHSRIVCHWRRHINPKHDAAPCTGEPVFRPGSAVTRICRIGQHRYVSPLTMPAAGAE